MMLCKADFEEIFPELFKPTKCALAETSVAANHPACIARWEDEGGRISDKMRHRSAPVSGTAGYGYAVPDPMGMAFALATMPVAAAYGAAWTMLSSFDRMAKR